MRRFLHNETRRRGTVVPLFAVLAVPLLAMLAFSIDVGWIALVKTDLQTAADAGALAGAEQLQGLYVQYANAGLPGSLVTQSSILTKATTNTHTADCPTYAAETFASYNKAGRVSISVRDQDVTFGFMDAQGAYHTDYWNYGGFPNSITVITRRDSLANSPLALFFGRMFGFASKELEATARATIYAGDTNSLNPIPGAAAHILPLAFDYNFWKLFFSTGISPDGTIHVTTSTAPGVGTGQPQIQVYPNPGNAPGSFGLLSVGTPSTQTPAFRNWITSGQMPNDINYLTNSNLVPVSLPGPDPAPGPKQWSCGTGMKSSLLGDFTDVIGVPNLLPLFIPASSPSTLPGLPINPMQTLSTGLTYQAATGTGSGATYAIVGFVGVIVSDVTGTGNNFNISVQPCATVDSTAVIWNPKPAGTQTSQWGSVITTFGSAKLTQ